MQHLQPGILWWPAAAVAAHLVEEFLWPGGFPAWYRRYRADLAVSITTRFLVRINALLVVMALVPPMLGATPFGLAIWLGVVTGIVHPVTALQAAFIGPGFHLWSAWNHGRRARRLATTAASVSGSGPSQR